MNKVIIIGCPGSGKSTFAKKLQAKIELPLYHLDMLFWNSDKTHVTRDIFDQKLSKVLRQDYWIIDGNYSRTIETRLIECDTVFLLDLPVEDCLAGINNRMGKPRNDMPWIEQEIDEEFKSYIIDFPQKELPRIYELLKKYNNKNIIIFNSHKQIKDYLDKI